MSGECPICCEPFNSSERCPKITDCGHTFCLACLRATKSSLQSATCYTCRQVIKKNPNDMITNYDAYLSNECALYCDECKKIAVDQCHRNAHCVRNLESFLRKKIEVQLQDLKAYQKVLENVTPFVLGMQDIFKTHLDKIMTDGDMCKDLIEDLQHLADRGMVNQLDGIRGRVKQFTEGKHLLERGLQLAKARSGAFTVELQCCKGGGGDGARYAAKFDLQAMAVENPDVLAATQVLMFVLSKHGQLRSQHPPAAAGERREARSPSKLKQQPPSRPRQGVNQQADQQQRQQQGDGRAGSSPLNTGPAGPSGRSAGATAAEACALITNDGVLDLGPPSTVGSAPYGQETPVKQALLRSAKMVTELKGLECNADPEFSKLLLAKHCSTLESVDLRRVQGEHFRLLSSMPKIRNLKVVGYDGRLGNFPAQPNSQLKSLYVHLPLKVQLAVWQAFAASVQTVTLRVEVEGVVDVHLAVQPLAAVSPRLTSLQLHRKDPSKHTQQDCDKQLDRVRRVFKKTDSATRVTCNMCRHQLSASD